jgi:hypothetical protein
VTFSVPFAFRDATTTKMEDGARMALAGAILALTAMGTIGACAPACAATTHTISGYTSWKSLLGITVAKH